MFILALMGTYAYATPDACDEGGGGLEGFALAVDAMDGHVVGQGGESVGRQVVVADFDGNSTPDLAVAGDLARGNGVQSGVVYVFLDADPTAVLDPAAADAVILGARAYERTGFALSVGDIDLDGVDDLVAGGLGQSRGSGWVYAVPGARIAVGGTIDPVSESVATWHSTTNYDSFGANVAVFDINGDTFDDVVVGAPDDDANGKNSGAVHVFLGPVSSDQVPADAVATIHGATAGGKLGDEVGDLGDMDGDGFPELGMGAYLDATGGGDAGALYVLRGGAWDVSPPGVLTASSADLRLYGKGGERLGRAFGGAADGSGDIWVSAVRAGTSKQGTVYRVPGATPDGGSPVAAVQTFQLQGFESGSVLGGSLAIGDVNGDGRPDLVAGAPYANGATRQAGAIVVAFGPFPGSARLATGAGIGKLGGSVYKQDLGASVAVGDLDGDGFDDVLAGSPRDPADGNGGGRVYVFRGGADSADLVTFHADADSDGHGSDVDTTVACSDDPPPGAWLLTGGDCVDDPLASGALYHPGAAEGCADPDYNCDGATGAVDGDGDGVAACLGDCDDDDANVHPGADEICGDGLDNDCANGADDPAAVDAQTWYIDADGDGFGYDAVPFTQCTEPTAGAFPYTLVGGDCLDSSLDPDAPDVNPEALEVCGDGLDNDCANGIDGAGAIDAPVWYADVDGDGFGDPFQQAQACTEPLGSWSTDPSDCDDADGAVKPGATETCNGRDDDCDGLFYMGGDLDLSEDAFRQLEGPTDGAKLGQGNVTVVGDQDLDGDGEIVVAYPTADIGASNVGVVLVVDGRADGGSQTLDPEVLSAVGAWSTRIRGTGTNMELGRGVATGDVNGDLVADLVVGAPGARFPLYQQGGVYVFFGPLPDGDLTVASADVVLQGSTASARAGASVAVGDVDADGFDDIVVGSPGATVDGLGESGMVQVVYGRSTGQWASATPLALALEADAYVKGRAGDRAGNDVAVLDLDGDTAADVVFGSTRSGTLSAGRMYVTYGLPILRRTGELTPDASYVGAQFNEQLTFSLASAGDVDADGDDDLLVSTNYNRAWLVLGDSARLDGVDASIAAPAAIRFDGALGAQAGERSTGIGDVNGDGFDDMAFDAVDDDGAGRDAGAVWIVYGRSDFTPVVPTGGAFVLNTVETYGQGVRESRTLEGAKISGSTAFDAFGSAVGGGDVDGDGFADLVAGASGADSGGLSDNGRVTVFRGGPFGADLDVSDGSESDWFADADGDGFTGATPVVVDTCPLHAPLGASPSPSFFPDCDDDDLGAYPGNPAETDGDGTDSDCDGFDGVGSPVDTDGDGLSDADEVGVFGTDPNLADTDGDGVDDGDEILAGTNPTLNCAAGRFDDGAACAPCPLGTYQPATGQAACLDADPGSYVGLAGATSQTPCDPGEVAPVAAADSCTPCAADTYEAGDRITCTACPGGSNAPAGSDDVGDCVALDPDTDGDGLTDADETNVHGTDPNLADTDGDGVDDGDEILAGTNPLLNCGAGTYDAGPVCAQCGPGQYQPLSGQSSCLGTDDGYFVGVSGATSQTPCDPGSWAIGSATGFCTACGPGEYQPASAATACLVAPPGEVAPGTGNTSTQDCAPGTQQPLAGQEVCVDCAAGTYQPAPGEPLCVDADPGSHVPAPGATAQLTCDPGTIAPTSGLQACTACGADTYEQGNTTCEACPPGTETQLPLADDVSDCVPSVPDADADGYSDAEELANGTDPNDAGDPWMPTTTSTAVALDLQQWRSCALRSDGTASCWGYDVDRTLYGVTEVPEPPPGESFVDIGIGWAHACALASDGTITCWGNAADNRISVPGLFPGYTYVDVSVGGNHTCALLNTGNVACWGQNGSGQVTAVAPPPGGFVAVATGNNSTCRLDSVGNLQCVGFPSALTTPPTAPAGETWVDVVLKKSTACAQASDDSWSCWGDGSYGQATVPAPPVGETFTTLAPGSKHTCAVASNGTITCWGDNTYGQLDAPSAPSGETFVDVASGDEHSCAIVSDGSVACWGRDVFGETLVPEKVLRPSDLYVGDDTLCILQPDGDIECRGGSEFYGAQSPGPKPVGAVRRSLDGGRFYGCATLSDGTLDCWGEFPIRPAGDPGPTPYPVVAPALGYGEVWTQVDGGEYHVCATTKTGEAACFGNTNAGQGDLPTLTDGLSWKLVKAGYTSSCGIVSDGTISCFGSTSFGLLSWPDPPAGEAFVDLEMSDTHACALATDATVHCWGRNTDGEATPPSDTDFVALALTQYTSCGLKADDSMVCWGQSASAIQTAYAGLPANGVEAYKNSLCRTTDHQGLQCRMGTNDHLVLAEPFVAAQTLAVLDADRDGVSAATEALYGTDPNAWDSDGDGVGDGREILDGTNPLLDCAAGAFDALASCLACEPGTYQPASGQDGCLAADAGAFAAGFGNDAQTACDPGDVALVSGLDSCETCWPDSFENGTRTACTWCPSDHDAPAGSDALGDCVPRPVDGDGDSYDDILEVLNGTDPGDPDDPTDRTAIATIVDLDFDAFGTCVCDDAGGVACYGGNASGALELPDAPPGETCVSVSVAGSNFGSCVTFSDGTYTCVGTSAAERNAAPVLPAGVSWLDVKAGGIATCGLRSDGLIDCWGTGGGDFNADQTPPPGEAFAMFETGGLSACAVTDLGSLHCWASSATHPILALPAPPVGHVWADVAMASSYGCALATDGSWTCWGDDTYDQLQIPAPPAGHLWRDVGLAIYAGCAVATDDTMACWGTGRFFGPITPIVPPAGTGFVTVDGGSSAVCATLTSQQVVCTGDAPRIGTTPEGPDGYADVVAMAVGPLDDPCLQSVGQDTFHCGTADAYWSAVVPPMGERHDRIAPGWNNVCALVSDGTIQCGGNDTDGKSTPPAPPAGHTFVDLAMGQYHGCAVASDGSVGCWGDDDDDESTPPAPPAGSAFVSVDVGVDFSCALTDTGSVSCWGSPDDGQTAPPSPAPGKAFTTLEVGYDNACVLVSDGSIACWGANTYGESTPPDVDDSPWVELSVGVRYACAIDGDGTVGCWGQNDVRQLEVQEPPRGTTYVEVHAGSDLTCGLLSDGSVACWGETLHAARTVRRWPFDDVDGDGIPDADEPGWGTDPLLADTDGDGRRDLDEIRDGTSPVLSCTAGTYEVGASCQPCAIGTYQPLDGATACLDAAPGTYVGATGATATVACDPGEVAPTPASVTCTPCGVGTFEAGDRIACTTCPFGTSTAPGSDDASDCGVPEIASLGMGAGHSCVILDDTTTHCWGGDTSQESTFLSPPPGQHFVQVDGGDDSTCGLTNTGTILCAGYDWEGETSAPSAPIGTSYTFVETGNQHTCALLSDGTIACWGNDDDGRSTPPPPPVGETFVELSVGTTYNCAVASDGTVSCWGYDFYGNATAPSPPAGQAFVDVSANDRHTCALVDDGSVVCWGMSSFGQTSVPALDPGLVYTAVETSGDRSCGLVSDGSLRCWGRNSIYLVPTPTDTDFVALWGGPQHVAMDSDGDLNWFGNTGGSQSILPTVPTGTAVVAFDIWDHAACMLRDDDLFTCFGTSGDTPVFAPGTVITDVAVSQTNACALLDGLAPSCWGQSGNGQLVFPALPPGETWEQLDVGRQFICGRASDDSVSCWGRDYEAQTTVPAAPAGASYTSVSVGEYHACAFATDDSITCWGSNSAGQTNVPSPPGGTTFVDVSAGNEHTCALLSDGTADCWGGDGYDQSTPIPPAAGRVYTQVVAANRSTCALDDAGEVTCWGLHDSTLPARAGTSYVDLRMGGGTACATVTDGTLSCWGFQHRQSW